MFVLKRTVNLIPRSIVNSAARNTGADRRAAALTSAAIRGPSCTKLTRANWTSKSEFIGRLFG